MKPDRAYLLIDGKLYLTTGPGIEPGNLYPVALGELTGNLPKGFGAIMAHHGAEVQLFGSRYEVNVLPTHGDCEDEIDLELVLLTRWDNPAPVDHEAYAVSLGMEPRRPEAEAVTAAALAACRALADAYDEGARRGGSVDWCDLDDADRAAREALALAGEPRPDIDDDDDDPGTCSACGRLLEDTPSGPRCPIMSLHTAEDFDKGGR